MISLFLKVQAIYELKMQINNLKLAGVLFLVSLMLVSCSRVKQDIEAEPEESKLTKTNNIRSSIPRPKFVEVDDGGNPYQGSPDAPVTLIVFSDFECQSCQQFYHLLKSIKMDYIESGKIRYVYRDYPLDIHEHALSAAICANCAGKQKAYWEMYAKLYENQDQLSDEHYLVWAKELRLDLEAFKSCLNAEEIISEVVNDLRTAKNMLISGTPAFIINNEMYIGVPPEEVFRIMLDDAIAKAAE
ncbi:MAG: DsbA family protein [Bacteroidetes bacterium]|nr:DsbA family protein [Bacteroidota bacterium]